MSSAVTFPSSPALVPERDAAYRLRGVYELVVQGCRDELVLAFDGASLTFRPDPDTDTLETRFVGSEFRPTPGHRPLSGTRLDRVVGAELGWSWLAVNQQGYCDTALLSFDGLTPTVAIHVIGSSVKVYGIDPTAG